MGAMKTNFKIEKKNLKQYLAHNNSFIVLLSLLFSSTILSWSPASTKYLSS